MGVTIDHHTSDVFGEIATEFPKCLVSFTTFQCLQRDEIPIILADLANHKGVSEVTDPQRAIYICH
jgi:hypothetical protein